MKNFNKRAFKSLLILLCCLFTTSQLFAQCSNYTEVCDGAYTGGTFSTFDVDGSTCLVNNGNAGYVVFNITTTGTLNVNINGDATTGFIDVAIMNIPPGVNPCTAAADANNEIACNFAPAAGGCAGFGNVASSGCTSVVGGPAVTAGDRIIIIVENYSSASNTYDVQLYDNAGNPVPGNNDGTDGADAGPPEADIDDTGGCTGDTFQVPNAGDYDGDNLTNAGGGTYSATCGTCINATTGMFTATTVGTFTVTYEHYSTGDPCYSTDDAIVTVDATPDIALTCPGVLCSSDVVDLGYVDNNAADATNGAPTVAVTGSGAAFVDANNMFDATASGAGTFTVTYTVTSVNGLCSDTETCTITVENCCPTVDTPANGTESFCVTGTPDYATAEGTIAYTDPTGVFGGFEWYNDAAFGTPATDPTYGDGGTNDNCNTDAVIRYVALLCTQTNQLIPAGQIAITLYPDIVEGGNVTIVDDGGCFPSITTCANFAVTNDYAANTGTGGAPANANEYSNGTFNFTIDNAAAAADAVGGACESLVVLGNYDCRICPQGQGNMYDTDICDGDAPTLPVMVIGTDVNGVQAGDDIWDPSNSTIGPAGVEWFFDAAFTQPYGGGALNHDGVDPCNPLVISLYAAILCDVDQDGAADDNNYIAVATFTVDIYPDLQNIGAYTNFMLNDDGGCFPYITTNCNFTIANDYAANTATGDAPANATEYQDGLFTFTITNNDANTPAACIEGSTLANYDCRICPEVAGTDFGLESICDGGVPTFPEITFSQDSNAGSVGGAGTDIWSPSDATLLGGFPGGVDYFIDAPGQAAGFATANIYTPGQNIVHADYLTDFCQTLSVTIYAAVLCDIDEDGQPTDLDNNGVAGDRGDYLVVGTYQVDVYAEILATLNNPLSEDEVVYPDAPDECRFILPNPCPGVYSAVWSDADGNNCASGNTGGIAAGDPFADPNCGGATYTYDGLQTANPGTIGDVTLTLTHDLATAAGAPGNCVSAQITTPYVCCLAEAGGLDATFECPPAQLADGTIDGTGDPTMVTIDDYMGDVGTLQLPNYQTYVLVTDAAGNIYDAILAAETDATGTLISNLPVSIPYADYAGYNGYGVDYYYYSYNVFLSNPPIASCLPVGITVPSPPAVTTVVGAAATIAQVTTCTSPFEGCFDLSSPDVVFIPEALRVECDQDISQGGFGGIGPVYYNIHEICIAGGTPAYDYHWDTDGYVRHSIIKNPGAGEGDEKIRIIYSDRAFWSVTVYDANGCTHPTWIFTNDISAPGALLDIAEAVVTPGNTGASQFNNCSTGQIDICVEGGTPPYTYDWYGPNTWTAGPMLGMGATGTGGCSAGSEAYSLTGLPLGWYQVTITDSAPAPDTQISYDWYWVYCVTPGRGKVNNLTDNHLTAMPNPANSTTTIAYSVTEAGATIVSLYDMSGKQVFDLFRGDLEANTTYTLPFSAGKLTSGIYILKLTTASGMVKNHKLILTK